MQSQKEPVGNARRQELESSDGGQKFGGGQICAEARGGSGGSGRGGGRGGRVASDRRGARRIQGWRSGVARWSGAWIGASGEAIKGSGGTPVRPSPANDRLSEGLSTFAGCGILAELIRTSVRR